MLIDFNSLAWRDKMCHQLMLAPAAAIGAIEDVATDLLHPLHGTCPARAYIVGIVVSRGSDLRQPYLAGRHCHGDLFRHRVMLAACDAILDAVAGEGKLAAVAPVLVLIDDPADRLRIGRVANTVEHDLSDRRLPFHRLAARLKIDSGG